ncbi:MAG: hypothetical protein H6709_22320 [Kofleriaceae bacterium]|nr:hypothetical protein [Kofleriaceae bacterium]MCB9574817.1 hypothetical protein [Kofleriaceae bacterium]
MHGPGIEAWDVATDEVAHDTPLPELLRTLVRYAILAPSTHNTQPWRFRVTGDAIEVWSDPGRILPRIDPTHRQLLMSCGAALFNLRIALRRHGHADDVDLLPSATHPDLLAVLRSRGPITPTERDEALFAAIPRRRTSRAAYLPRPVSAVIADELAHDAGAEGAWLCRLHPHDKLAVADLVATADRKQFADPAFRDELARWLVPRGSGRRDGIPMIKKDVMTAIPLAATLLVRSFDRGGGIAAREAELATASPLLAVLGTDLDDPSDWLAAGQAMQAVLLRATSVGLSASFLNQALEEAEIRPRVGDAARRHGYPQLVLRFGVGPEVPPTPRRPLAEVMFE